MRRTFLSAFIVPLTISFCSCATLVTRTITLTQFETGEVLKGTVNTVSHAVTIIMPNGEVLQGNFTAVTDRVEDIGNGVEANGTAYALLKSPSSNLMLEIHATFEGVSGFGDAQTNTGKRYRVQF